MLPTMSGVVVHNGVVPGSGVLHSSYQFATIIKSILLSEKLLMHRHNVRKTVRDHT